MIAATMFSGIGAPEAAMPHWTWSWSAEIEKFPCAVMAKRHPQSVNLGDVSAQDFIDRAQERPRARCIVFGSPCQSFSVAGRRLGLDDPRGNLALIALGVIDRLKPDWFAFENVPGLFSSYSGSEQAEGLVRSGRSDFEEGEEDRDFAAFLTRVSECGYHVAWSVLDAQYFGLAQRRERVIVVGHRRDWRGPAAVLFEPESLCGNHPPRREAGKRVAPTLEARADAGGAGWGTDFLAGGGMVAGAVSSKWHKGTGGPAGDECYNLVADPITASEGRTYTHEGKNNFRLRNVIGFDPTQITSPVNRSQPTDLSPTLVKQAHIPSLAFSCKDHGADATEDVAPTLRAMTHDETHANGGGQIALAQGKAVRRLTPRECERLQGFEDDYTAVTYRGKPAADGPRYKALGNSMAVDVIRWVLTRIEAVDSILEKA